MSKFNINALIALALEQPAHAPVYLQPYEGADSFHAQAVARGCAGFAQINREALLYTGKSSQVLGAQVDALEKQMEFHRKEVLRLRAELIRMTGGAEATAAAAAAGIEVVFDQALVDGQHKHENARYKLSQDIKEVYSQLSVARASEQARAEFVTVLGALLAGVL